MKYLVGFLGGIIVAVALMNYGFAFFKCDGGWCEVRDKIWEERQAAVDETINLFRKCDVLFVQNESDTGQWLALNEPYVQAQTPDKHSCWILKKAPQSVDLPDHEMTNVSIFGGR